MTQWIERNRNGAQNAEIANGAREYFGQTTADREGKYKYGSFNSLTILQSGTGQYKVILDGLANRTFTIPSTGSFNIKPEEGIFFDYVIVEADGATIPAGAITVNYGIAQVVA